MSLTIQNYNKLESWSHNYKEFMIGIVSAIIVLKKQLKKYE